MKPVHIQMQPLSGFRSRTGKLLHRPRFGAEFTWNKSEVCFAAAV